MALVKCKECGKEISKKAEACPNCGAKPKKATSVFTWLVLALIVAFVYGGMSGDPTSTKSSTQSTNLALSQSSSSSKPKAKKAAPTPRWSHVQSNDEMSGETSYYAFSPDTAPTRRLEFPLQDLTSFIGVGCKKGSQWAYFKFSSSPNLINDETKDGYNLIKARIKWGDKLDTVTLTQEWGAEALHARYKKDFISKLKSNDTVMLELSWYSQNTVRFKYDLNKSTSAIDEIISNCKK